MTTMTLERIAELEDHGMGDLVAPGEWYQLLSLAKRALESESRPQSHGVPTGLCEVCITTTDGRDIEQHDCGKLARLKVNGFPMCAACFDGYEEEGLVESVEPLAHERGRSQAAGDGWVSAEERLPEENEVVIAIAAGAWSRAGTCRFDGPAEGWHDVETGRRVPDIITHWRPLPAPPSDSGKVE